MRERLEDLPLLSDAFRRDFAEKHSKDVDVVAEDVIERFRAHDWPGNVRELRNAVETMVVLDRDGSLGLDDLPPGLRQGSAPGVRQAPSGAPLERSTEAPAAPPVAAPAPSEAPPAAAAETPPSLAGRSLREVEAELIRQTLEACDGNRQRAAEKLGMGERTLYRKIKEYDL